MQLVHTAWLRCGDLDAVRGLLRDCFDDLTEPDVEHALGGLHAMVWDGGELVAHGSVVMRRLLHGGRALRCGYVEAVAVRADRRRQGHGSAVVARLEQVVRGAYDVGALGATDEAVPLYTGRGWVSWRGTTSVVHPDGGLRRTPDDDGGVYVLPVTAALDLDGDLACDWRDGDVW